MTDPAAAGAGPAPTALLSRAEREALAEDVELLARLADRELDAELIRRLRGAPPADWFALDLAGAEFEAVSVHVVEGLAAIGDPPTPADLDELAADFAAIFLTHGYNAAPTESVWRDEDGLERQDAMFLVRDWYARHGVKAADWRKRSDDHLVSELEFLALLLRRARDEAGLRAAATFLRDHPLVWAPRFADRVAARCQLQVYAGSVLLTAVYLEQLGRLLGPLAGLDMTPPPLILAKPKAPQGPDCNTPRNTQFNGPGW
ncbi:MAG: molecular chaperone TorD family protein [Methylobacteriaceae bacterium]|nr:molecular chaperone TorD family protein [Methylobacteriaceae bacterium]